jgi:3-dehydroquinate dehydratase / shikimate dehydrogenase
MAMVCISIMVDDVDTALLQSQAARDGGADLVEFRIDLLFSGSGDVYEERQVLRLVAESPLPCIVTCRPVWEGGHYDGNEMERVALFERLGTAFGECEHPPKYIDVELAAYTRSPNIRAKVNLAIEHPEQIRDVQTSLILSVHDFEGRPADLSRKLLKLREQQAASIHKIAWRARSLRDNLELFDILAQRERPTIALGMGEFGLMSRLLAPKFGGFLTYAGLGAQSTTAPGQPALGELLETYRFRSIGPQTRVYGVIGYPLRHSLSPLVHNAGFEAVGHDGVYLPLPVAGTSEGAPGGYESLKATLCELIDCTSLDFCGASVTSPHKEHLVRLARELGWELDATAASSGAANTIIIDREDGRATRVRISNTDAPAVLELLREALGDLSGKSMAVLGAGGLGRALAHALAVAGARVVVHNRTRKRADDLVSALMQAGTTGIAAGDWEAVGQQAVDALINCTPAGMAGTAESGVSPVAADILRRIPGALVMDTVYTPAETPLLQLARSAGSRTIDGVSMFVRQAAAQFSGWTGKPAPTMLFDRMVREHLSSA